MVENQLQSKLNNRIQVRECNCGTDQYHSPSPTVDWGGLVDPKPGILTAHIPTSQLVKVLISFSTTYLLANTFIREQRTTRHMQNMS